MSLLTLNFKHGQTQEQARAHLERVVQQFSAQYGALIQRIEWSRDRNAVEMTTAGIWVKLDVDATEVHVTADLPGLLGIFANPLLSGLRGMVETEFKQLPYQP
jgi:hypothetical protein